MSDVDALRSLTVQVAESFVGLGANDADTQKYLRYLGLVAPGEALDVQKDMGNMSGCGLVVAGIWRAVGVWEQKLYAPYVIGSAISRLFDIAEAHGAWVGWDASRRPSPGDMVHVGAGTPQEHVYTVLEVSADGSSLTTVDGGQKDSSGYQIILQKTRTWSGSVDMCGGVSRTISGWIDVAKLGASTAPPTSFFQNAPDGAKGFAARAPVDAEAARAQVGQGYRFCLRSLSTGGATGGLTLAETQALLLAGVAVSAFAPRPATGWDPTSRDASADAREASEAARAAGLAVGTALWLELADVAAGAAATGIEAYCNAWYDEVLQYGLTPAMYVGQSPGLDSGQLFQKLKASHYARATSAAPDVATRGYQIAPCSGAAGDLASSQDSEGDRAPWMVFDPVVVDAAAVQSTSPSSTTPTQTMGVDVATYQGTVDWTAASGFDVRFAFIKATEGTSITDDRFAQNWAGTKSAGVLRSAYHYFTHSSDPVAQADYFLSVVGGDFDLPLVLDLESTSGIPQADVLASNVKAFLDRVEQQSGVRPIIYTYPSFWMTYMTAATWAAAYDLWIAHYDTQSPIVPAPWTRWTFWQFKGGYSVPGKNKSIDLNWFAGSMDDLRAYCVSGSSTLPPVEAPSTPPPGETPSTIQVTASSLSLRLGASTSSTKVGELPSGTRVSVVEGATDGAGNQWYGVELWVAGVYGGSPYVKPV